MGTVALYFFFFDGYCSTVQGLLDWFEVDLGFTELSFIQIDLCVLGDFVLYSDIVSDFARFHKFLRDTTQCVCLNKFIHMHAHMSSEYCSYICMRIYLQLYICSYGVALVSRID